MNSDISLSFHHSKVTVSSSRIFFPDTFPDKNLMKWYEVFLMSPWKELFIGILQLMRHLRLLMEFPLHLL